MAVLQVPLRNDLADFKFNLPLDETFYTFRFKWNTRMANWFMDILTLDETPILEGVPVFSNFAVISRFKDIRLPPGRLYFYDTSGNASDPLRFDLGERVIMVYEDEAENG